MEEHVFTWINKQGVKSERGFIVQSVGRFTIEYREDLKILSVEVENGFLSDKKPCEIVRADAFRKWDDGTIIPEEKQIQILQNFKEAMEFQGIAVIVN